jgi:hypothetical protein
MNPNTLLRLDNLAHGAGADNAQSFKLSVELGLTYITIDHTLKNTDSFQVITPAAVLNIRGTKFYTFVSRLLSTYVMGDEHIVEVSDAKGQDFQNSPDTLTAVTFGGLTPLPHVCTIDFLNKQADGVILKDLKTDAGRNVFRTFLADWLASNVNPLKMTFFQRLLNLPDTTTAKDIEDNLKNFNKDIDFPGFLSDTRGYMTSYFSSLGKDPVAPATCGNGKKDSGETADNCNLDVTDVKSTCGNGLCETNPQGESYLNCPADCLPNGALALSCTNLNGRSTVSTGIGQPGGTGTQPAVIPPKPSGVGG